jgi:hypothetical protein
MTEDQQKILEVLRNSDNPELADKLKDMLTNCEECGAKCCKYVMFDIDPEWTYLFYLLFQGIHIQIDLDSNEISALVETKCMQLDENGKCKVYDSRPQVCREHANLICYEMKAKMDQVLVIRTPNELVESKDIVMNILEVNYAKEDTDGSGEDPESVSVDGLGEQAGTRVA